MRVIIFLVLLSFSWLVSAKVSDKYCGNKNCYELLNVTQEATQADIKKAYRSLSLVYHPDKNPGKDTTAIYREINQAYEVLSNEDIRSAYNEYLENPDQSEYYQYYRFYKAVYAPHTDPKLVVGLFVGLFSVFQYFAKKTMYKNVISQVERSTKFQTMVNQRMEEAKAEKQNLSREEIVAELRGTVQIHGGYSPPKIFDLLFFQLIFLPYYIGDAMYKNVRWVVLFWILKRPYGPAEREELTRRKLGLSETRWKMIPDFERENFIQLELWDDANFNRYMKEMREKQMEQLAGSGKYKQYQRFMKSKKGR